ncbi:unnamed protein product [Cylicocyclus nassatus]|uniref:Uncharacterized protein n=1 Tax=Cylicocyclus nassatus TaxID=53992 RepID=A0AA36GYJ1_CYLNA|nr:unnamed protein product [Cylicocyclus nassatus]
MMNFATQFTMFKSRTEEDRTSLETVRKTISVKKEINAKLKEEVEKYKNSDIERQQRRENARKKRVELRKKIIGTFAQTKALSAEMECFDEQRVSNQRSSHEIRSRVADFRARISCFVNKQKNLEIDLTNLQHPASVDPTLVSEVREKADQVIAKASVLKNVFDMTALVAEIQAIENLRKERLKKEEELATKTHTLAALDAEHEALELKLEEEQRKFLQLQSEDDELKQVLAKNTSELEELESAVTQLNADLEGLDRELQELDAKIAIETQRQNEMKLELKVTSEELEQYKSQWAQAEQELMGLKKDLEKEEINASTRLANLKKDYEDKVQVLIAKKENHIKEMEETTAEIAKMEKMRVLQKTHRDNANTISEKQTKLAELQNELNDLRKRIEEKNEKQAKDNERLSELRRDVSIKKDDMIANIENAKVQLESLQEEVIQNENEAVMLQNRKYEIEGELHLARHQVEMATEKLVVAKNTFIMKQIQEEQAKQDKDNERQRKRERRERKRHKENENTVKEMKKQRAKSSEVMRSRSTLRETQEKVHDSQQFAEHKRIEKQSFAEPKSIKQVSNESVPRISQPITDKSASLQHTNTIASILADEFKRHIAVDLDDTVMKEDDGGDLFGSLEDQADTLEMTITREDLPVKNKPPKTPVIDDNEIHFEPNELFTSTPLLAKRQPSIRPTRTDSAGYASQTASGMPPFRDCMLVGSQLKCSIDVRRAQRFSQSR